MSDGELSLIDRRSAPICPSCGAKSEVGFGGQSWSLPGAGSMFRYGVCTSCDLAFSDPMPTVAELDNFYATGFDYSWYIRRRRLKRIQGRHRWFRVGKRLERLVGKKGSLLDVGCGAGWFLSAAKRAGWDAQGLELPGADIEFGKQALGLQIKKGTLFTQDFPEASFDAITMWHSLEHMLQPVSALEHVCRLLKPGGVLLGAVPNLHAKGLSVSGANWVWLQQPYLHPWHFSPKSASDFASRAGLIILSTESRDTWDAQYLYDSVVNRVVVDELAKPMEHRAGQISRQFGFPFLVRGVAELNFIATELARIASYAAYLMARPGTAPRNDGSELLFIASRPRR